jgi:hypothetical protein
VVAFPVSEYSQSGVECLLEVIIRAHLFVELFAGGFTFMPQSKAECFARVEWNTERHGETIVRTQGQDEAAVVHSFDRPLVELKNATCCRILCLQGYCTRDRMRQSHDERHRLVKWKFDGDGLASFIDKTEMNGMAFFDHTALGQAAGCPIFALDDRQHARSDRNRAARL